MTRRHVGGPHDPEDAAAPRAPRRSGTGSTRSTTSGCWLGADFPFYAAAGGPACRDCLAGYEVLDGRLRWVELRSGDWTSPQGPHVTVRTQRTADPADPARALPLPELEDAVEDERDRVYDQLDIDEGDGPGLTRALRGWISVDGEPCPVEIHEDVRPPGPDGTDPAGGAPVWVPAAAGRRRRDRHRAGAAAGRCRAAPGRRRRSLRERRHRAGP
ncbi:hypothetical protein ACFQ1I_31655 [Kitasatospora arboriphila]